MIILVTIWIIYPLNGKNSKKKVKKEWKNPPLQKVFSLSHSPGELQFRRSSQFLPGKVGLIKRRTEIYLCHSMYVYDKQYVVSSEFPLDKLNYGWYIIRGLQSS